MDWDKTEPDSVFAIFLEPKGNNVTVHDIHANPPDKYAGGVDKGWHTHYWEPRKQYLAGTPIEKHPTM